MYPHLYTLCYYNLIWERTTRPQTPFGQLLTGRVRYSPTTDYIVLHATYTQYSIELRSRQSSSPVFSISPTYKQCSKALLPPLPLKRKSSSSCPWSVAVQATWTNSAQVSPPQSRFTDSRAKFNCCSRVQTRFSWPPVHWLKRITFQILEKKSDFCAIQLITIIIISSGLGAQCGSIKSAIIILVVISVSVIIQEAEPTTTVSCRTGGRKVNVDHQQKTTQSLHFFDCWVEGI